MINLSENYPEFIIPRLPSPRLNQTAVEQKVISRRGLVAQLLRTPKNMAIANMLRRKYAV